MTTLFKSMFMRLNLLLQLTTLRIAALSLSVLPLLILMEMAFATFHPIIMAAIQIQF